MIGTSALFSLWENYGIKPPGGHQKSNEALDWEKPVWVHQGQLVLKKPDNLL